MAERAICAADKMVASTEALQRLEEHASTALDALAARTDVDAEVLHFIAQNGGASTRRAVAASATAAPDTNLLLSQDDDIDVRGELARKIGRLFPGLLEEEQRRLRNTTIQILQKLAKDEAASVRAILAEEIKSLDCVPYEIVKQLADDTDPLVAAPLLEFSPRLDDRTLIEIIAASRASGVLSAVARRKGLSEDVSDAVAATLDISAVAELLANTSAAIRTKTLDRIISNAADVSEWHNSLVVRAELSRSAIKRLAAFVASSYIAVLASRAGLDKSTQKYLARRLEERRKAESVPPTPEWGDASEEPRGDTFSETFVAEAIEGCKRDVVVRTLSISAKVDEAVVRKVLESGSAEGAVALVWRAGLSMRVAYKLQVQVMRLAQADLLYPRNGSEYPLTEERMLWQLRFWGIA